MQRKRVKRISTHKNRNNQNKSLNESEIKIKPRNLNNNKEEKTNINNYIDEKINGIFYDFLYKIIEGHIDNIIHLY